MNDKPHAAFQEDRSGHEVPFFNQHVSSTVFKAVVYRRLNRFRAYRNAVASRAELSNCF